MTDDQTDETQPISRDDLRTMHRDEINAARREGRLAHLTGAPVKPPADGQLNREHLKAMTATEIEIARAAGRLDNLLNRNNNH